MGQFKSETAKCRDRLFPFCRGRVVDIGCGTVEKICPAAIGVDARPGIADHVGPIDRLEFLADGSIDVCFSSHALEHLQFPVEALKEWIRVLRPGGRLVLYLPHREHYKVWNPDHHFNPSPEVVMTMIGEAAKAVGRSYELIHEFLDVGEDRYSFDLVVRLDQEVQDPVEPLRVFMRPEGFDGSSFLRARWPAEWLQRLGLADVKVSEVGTSEDVSWANVCVFQRATALNGGLTLWRQAGDLGVKRVYDTDDDLFRHPDVLGRPYYSAASIKAIQQMMEEADLVTCSTPGVAMAMQGFARKTAVLPNGVHPALFDLARTQRPGQVCLGFSAAPAHDEDFELIASAVANILKKNADVRMVFQGHVPSGAKQLPGDRLMCSPWVSFSVYPQRLATLGIDILLVPWADTPFNRGKSLVKWLDASYIGAAVIATPISDYADICRHGETALLVNDPKDWEMMIDALIGDPVRRQRIAEAARQESKAMFGYDVLSSRWASTYRTLLDNAH